MNGQAKVDRVRGVVYLENGRLQCPPSGEGRLLLRGGHLVDPANNVNSVQDIALSGSQVSEVSRNIPYERGDRIVNCEGLLVIPGLIDIHLHLHDLFEVSTDPAVCAAQDGVTLGLSPGAGNTFMAPALLGAEMDRGFPVNAGLFLGGGAVLSCCLDNDEMTALFNGTLPPDVAEQKLTRNPITNQTAPLVVGIKEHMGHAILSDENLDRLYHITSRAGLLFMSHTQDVRHTVHIESRSGGRPLHLGHATAAGCGEEAEGAEAMAVILDLCAKPHVTGELVSTMLRPGRGSREGLTIGKRARQLCFDALHNHTVNILVSDGQHQATMKGFGDTRDNVPAILELVQQEILGLPDAVATMTQNPARLLAGRTGNTFWTQRFGHLGTGALANVTIVNPSDKTIPYTIVNGQIVSFENRLVRGGMGAGNWVCAKGMVSRFGAGDIAMFRTEAEP